MLKLEKGKCWTFGSNVSTDLIAPGRLSFLRSNLSELAKHVLEDADPEFPKKLQPGDYIVAGENFGTGSSREHAAEILRLAQVRAVVAKSFARIFYRNASNIGLWLIQADTDDIETGDTIEINLKLSELMIVNKQRTIPCAVPEKILLNILRDGGLIAHLKKHGRYSLDDRKGGDEF